MADDRGEGLNAAVASVLAALSARNDEANGVGDQQLVNAGARLCAALKGVDFAFWDAMNHADTRKSPGLGFWDNLAHANEFVIPACQGVMESLGARPDEAIGMINGAVDAYTELRRSAPDEIVRRIAEARDRFEALTEKVCSLSREGQQKLRDGGGLDKRFRTRLRRLLRRGILGLFWLGVLADVLQVTQYVEAHPPPRPEAVQHQVGHLSEVGRDAIRVMGLHEVARVSDTNVDSPIDR